MVEPKTAMAPITNVQRRGAVNRVSNSPPLLSLAVYRFQFLTHFVPVLPGSNRSLSNGDADFVKKRFAELSAVGDLPRIEIDDRCAVRY